MDETLKTSAMVNKTLNKTLFQTAVGREVIWRSSGGHLRASGDHLGTGPGGSILRSFWVNSGANSRPILVNLINILKLRFIRPWVGP